MYSRLDGLPHQEPVIPVEVVGNVLCAVHTPSFDGLREAQGGIGQVLHGLLHHLHVSTTPCGIGLEWEGREHRELRSVAPFPSCPDLTMRNHVRVLGDQAHGGASPHPVGLGGGVGGMFSSENAKGSPKRWLQRGMSA